MPKILHQGVHSLVGRVGRRRGQGTRGDKRPPLRDCVRGGSKELWEEGGDIKSRVRSHRGLPVGGGSLRGSQRKWRLGLKVLGRRRGKGRLCQGPGPETMG